MFFFVSFFDHSTLYYLLIIAVHLEDQGLPEEVFLKLKKKEKR